MRSSVSVCLGCGLPGDNHGIPSYSGGGAGRLLPPLYWNSCAGDGGLRLCGLGLCGLRLGLGIARRDDRRSASQRQRTSAALKRGRPRFGCQQVGKISLVNVRLWSVAQFIGNKACLEVRVLRNDGEVLHNECAIIATFDYSRSLQVHLFLRRTRVLPECNNSEGVKGSTCVQVTRPL